MAEYEAYKDSGFEWLGNIPVSWPIVLLSQIVTQVKNKNSDLREQNLLSLSYGRIKRKPIDTNGGLLPESFDGYNVIEANDIVLRLTDLQNDHRSLRVGLATERGIITSAYTTMRPRNSESAKYLYYLLHTFDIRKGFYGMGSGVRQGLNYDEVKKLKLPLPTIVEQEAIAAYLDTETERIDAIIAEAKASIEEYKAWKASIIYEAVTKGLDPNVEMKDSGVEWIGEIPASWEYIPLKLAMDNTHGSAIRVGPFGSALSGSDIADEGIWVYNQRSVLDNNFSTNNTFVSEEKANELAGFRVFPGDILITTRGSIGRVAIVPHNAPEGILHPCIIRFRTNKKILNDELLRILFNESDFVLLQMRRMSNSTTIDVLYSYNLKELRIPLIPPKEQAQITKFLVKKCAIINSIIKEEETLIADLESYKKSLIFEVVTGKRKVV